MKYDLQKPCGNCPFLKKGGVHLRLGRIREIHRVVTGTDPRGGGTFPCHKTVDHDQDSEDDDEEFEDEHKKWAAPSHPNASHCAGAIIYSLKLEMPNQMTRIAMRLGSFDADRMMKHSKKVHDSLDGWISADPIASSELHEQGDDEYVEPCSVSDHGCEAPAGWLVNGSVEHGTESAEYECAECGSPVCGACSEDIGDGARRCNDCSES